jgi:hypothetical protein
MQDDPASFASVKEDVHRVVSFSPTSELFRLFHIVKKEGHPPLYIRRAFYSESEWFGDQAQA